MAFEEFEEISRRIHTYLSAAGWEQTTRSRESNVPEFSCPNTEMSTTLFQHIRGKSVTLTFATRDAHRRAEVSYGESIGLLLPLLVTWGRHLSVETLGLFLEEISKSVPEVLLEPLEGDADTEWEMILPA
ncbi:hypothetical protein [Streptomyces sp. NPDC058653]|uniref:hypothetical protein n=1 Tax=Streptomyces sp. NPDC058653 TaxID=3346576 RepID=UPI003659E53A